MAGEDEVKEPMAEEAIREHAPATEIISPHHISPDPDLVYVGDEASFATPVPPASPQNMTWVRAIVIVLAVAMLAQLITVFVMSNSIPAQQSEGASSQSPAK